MQAEKRFTVEREIEKLNVSKEKALRPLTEKEISFIAEGIYCPSLEIDN